MRDAIYVGDVVDAWMLALNSDVECDVFNIGTGKCYTVNKVAEMLGTKITYIPCPIKNYVIEHQANITKAKEKLGFEARYSLEEGIKKLTEVYG